MVMAGNPIVKKKKGYYRGIQRYIEFLMSDGNLRRDKFLKEKLNTNLEISMSEFLGFNRIKNMKADLEDIKTAMRPSRVLDIVDDEKVRKKTTIVERSKEELDSCTIYVERIPPDITTDYLLKTFSAFGKVAYITLPKYKKNRRIKGYAFIEFENEASCAAALKKYATYEGTLQNQNNADSAPGPSSSIGIDSAPVEMDGAPVETNGEVKDSNEDSACDDGEDSVLPDTQPTKKKNRKKRKSQRRLNQCFMNFQVMSKANWNQLRTRYLTIQTTNRRRMKMQLAKVKRPVVRHPKINGLISGSVLTICSKEPLSDRDTRALKKNLRQIEAVEFIDIENGQSNGYVRFTSAQSASSFLSHSAEVLPNYRVEILDPELEGQYWTKVESDRLNRFKQLKDKKKVSGGKQILKRAEKQLGVKVSNDVGGNFI